MLHWLERERISILHLVPARAQFWLDHAPTEVSLLALRLVFFAGEPLTDTLVRRWRDTFSADTRIVNLYGPTEMGLAKCYYEVPENPSEACNRWADPCPKRRTLVFTRKNQPCGVGEVGEIVLRTPFRTLGYLNAPGQGGFVRNPFRQDESDWLYYTGDLGRYRPDGTLDILGRRDDQVKIRGVRVEPAEVAARLQHHASVKNCVVLPLIDEQGQAYLVAYVVATRQGVVSTLELRSYLEEYLPAALIPSYFVLWSVCR